MRRRFWKFKKGLDSNTTKMVHISDLKILPNCTDAEKAYTPRNAAREIWPLVSRAIYTRKEEMKKPIRTGNHEVIHHNLYHGTKCEKAEGNLTLP